MRSRHFGIAVSMVCLIVSLASGPGWAEGAPSKALRLYSMEEGRKRYFTGYDWIRFDVPQKAALVEKARSGATKLNAVMLLPPGVYIRELDRMYGEAAEARQIEVGQAIQGIAITLKDWDDGTDPDKKLEAALDGEAPAAQEKR